MKPSASGLCLSALPELRRHSVCLLRNSLFCRRGLSSLAAKRPPAQQKERQSNAWMTGFYTVGVPDVDEPKFSKILIANRGEIACRVVRTCRSMGIATVAVHSDVDSNAMHVVQADESVCIGPAATSRSYLRMDRILDAVKKTGAQAVHPGYGFLSENTEFAKQLTEAGGTFIGPNSKAIRAMGDKIESKRIAAKASVNMIPGYDGEIKDADECVRVSRDIGYPVMIKASAGGGGKGMRIAWNDKEAADGYRLSKEEAASSFGDDRMLVEKYIDKPRHIEMQVLCDKHGNALWLNERECSIQRRNQKVIEEAPSPFVDPDMRQRMGEQACALALHVGYDSAGTVEFLVDAEKNFYFLEMNTRLQVEHPITEAITGIDLVQQMVRVAYGHKLNFGQQDIGIRGWSFESRVYAEDPYKGFGLPSVGRLSRYVEPTHLPGVRCDSGVREGSEISIYYDPLICKLIASGASRAEALDRMRAALDEYVIRGVTHNIPLLRDIMEEERFRSGDITTNYLPETYPDGFMGASLTPMEEVKLSAVAAALQAVSEAAVSDIKNVREDETRQSETSGRFVADYTVHLPAQLAADDSDLRVVHAVHVDFKRDDDVTEATVVVDGTETIKIQGPLCSANPVLTFQLPATADEPSSSDDYITQVISKTANRLTLVYKGSPFKVSVFPSLAESYMEYMPVQPKIDYSSVILAPMPGLVKSVSAELGQMVSEGQELCVIEAMKMQNSLTAGKTGKVKAVHCETGRTVDEGEVLVELE